MEYCWVSISCFLLLSFITPSLSSEYFVVAKDGISCPEGYVCHDLSYYVNQSVAYFTSDSTLTFLEGTHILDQDGPVVISDVSNLTLQGEGIMEEGFHWTVKQSTVFIRCRNATSGFYLADFKFFVLIGLTIVDCGFRLSPDMKESIGSRYNVSRYNWDYAVSTNASFSVLLANGVNAWVEDFSVQNGTGYGLTTVNVYDIEIVSSSFSRNNIDCDPTPPGYLSSQGGNVRFAYIDSIQCPDSSRDSNIVLMKGVSLSFGRNCGVYMVPKGTFHKVFEVSLAGGGIAIMANSLKCGKVSFEFNEVNAISNIGTTGSNVFVFGFPMSMKFDRFNCSYGMEGYRGSGITIFTSQSPPDDYPTELSFTNSGFIGNNRSSFGNIGTAIYLRMYSSKFYNEVTLKSCYFSNNIGFSILTIIKDNDISNTQTLHVNLNDVVMYENGSPGLTDELDFVGAVVLVNCICHASGLKVVNSYITGIEILSTTLTFTGNNLIQNNTFINGGGMVLLGRSVLIFQSPTVVSFVDNHADKYGGAIYIPINVQKTYIGPCFYQIAETSTTDVVIRAVNNSAGTTGSFLSGGSLGFCYLVRNSTYSFVEQGQTSYHYLLSLIVPRVDPSDVYFLSSSPVGVVFCERNGTYSTTIRFVVYPYNYIPSKEFNVSITTVSEFGSIAPGTALVRVCNVTGNYCCDHDMCTYFSKTQTIDTINRCFNFTLVLPGNSYTKALAIELTTRDQVPYQTPQALYIIVKPSDCPPGFTANFTWCVCSKYIHSVGGNCNINTTTITTNGSVWIGYDSTFNCTLYSDICPNDYCVGRNVTFNIIDSPDLQCANHRSGVLCGQCAEGYSLLLGSNECGLCPNSNYLSLLLVFGVAGIALVVLLIALNLTVSVGTINGLIFYANIVKINEYVFFPRDSSQPLILRQFISFINLDFGLKTCFYNGMTPYVKAWLQFVFPLYIWFLMIIVILLSRRFTKVSKLIGNNAVKVLATLLLLSYTKIIRAIGVALALESVYCDNDLSIVWKADGNMPYGSPEHFALAVFASLVLVCFVLPYSLLLISLPFVGKFFTLIHCNFLRLKPFTDAYGGPFKNSHQFWPGLLLIARVVLTIVRVVVIDDGPSIFITIFCIMSLLTLALDIRGPYQKNYLNVLESWFLVNLLGLFVLSLRTQIVSTGSIVLVSLVMVSFVVILCIHIYFLFRDHFLGNVRKFFKHEQNVEIKDVAISISVADANTGCSKSVVTVSQRKATFSRYRDSILNSFNGNSDYEKLV